VVLQDTGNQLFIQPTMNGCCQLTGDSAQDGSFTASCVCPSGGFGCNENYSLTGTFQTPTSWTGTFSASFNGMLCGDCTFYNTNITGTLQ
jgi:hypothetical protein